MLIGYARVSTADQNPALQRDALKQAGCERIFEEAASGAKENRPQLTAALDHMRKGDTLVVWKLDRLARSMKQLIETVGQLETAGVKFRSITENIGTDSAGGRFVFHIIGALAEFERSLIRERTAAGLRAARARGRKGGRPKSMTAGDVQAAEALLAGNVGPGAIAKRMGVSRATLYRHLKQANDAVHG
jgi:DNA invertase Pin-like site-specific DNA recombinase